MRRLLRNVVPVHTVSARSPAYPTAWYEAESANQGKEPARAIHRLLEIGVIDEPLAFALEK